MRKRPIADKDYSELFSCRLLRNSVSADSHANVFLPLYGTYTKNVEPVCHSSHAVKALALPGKPKRATLKAPRRCTYIDTPKEYGKKCHKPLRMYIIHLIGRSRCFVFDLPLNLRDSYCVKTKAYSYAFYVYASALPLPNRAFSMDSDIAKLSFFLQTSHSRKVFFHGFIAGAENR